jgi:alpha-amylase
VSETAAATALQIVFEEKVQTVYGENIYLVGSIAQLGNWDPDNAVKLSADAYTSANPVWTVTISLPVGMSFEYKFVKKTGADVVWESDPNRQYTVPGGCEGEKKTLGGSWR